MNWSATSTTPPLFGTGTLEIVQTVTPSASFMLFPTPSKQYNDPENGLYGLDTGYPYPGPAYSEGTVYQTDDSPSIGLTSAIGSVTMQHQFTDYIMFQPPGSGEWVPLGTATWSTNGNATVPTTDNWGDYVTQNGSDSAGMVMPTNSTNFTPTNAFPSWTRVNVFPNTGTWN